MDPWVWHYLAKVWHFKKMTFSLKMKFHNFENFINSTKCIWFNNVLSSWEACGRRVGKKEHSTGIVSRRKNSHKMKICCIFTCKYHPVIWGKYHKCQIIASQEEFEDTNGVIRIRMSKKNRQHNGQRKKDKRANNDLQNIHIKQKIE